MRRVVATAALVGLLLAACSGTGPGGVTNTVAFIPDYQPGGGIAAAAPQGYSRADQPIVAVVQRDADLH